MRSGGDTRVLALPLSLSPPGEDTARRWPSAPRKRELTKESSYQHPGHGRPARRAVREKCLSAKPARLWCFVTAA